MQNISTQSNQQLCRCVFSKVTECLEQKNRKQIDCKRPSSTKQMNIKFEWIFELKFKNKNVTT